MASEPTPWALTIPSDLRLLALAREFVGAVCSVAGLDEPTTNAVVMATDEATNNVIRHAHRGRPEALLQIQCRFSAEAAEVSVIDEGPPFDLSAVPHLDPSEIRVGGRGVFMMRALMDELSIEPRAGQESPGGNVLRMVKRLRRA
jgi:serine/threonine-protein kinase RsbW